MARRLVRWIFYRYFSSGTLTYRLFLRHAGRIRRLAFWLTLFVYPVFCMASWTRVGFRKLLRKKPSVIWGPTPVITIADGSEVLQSLGYDSRTLVFTSYYISNKFDYNLKDVIQNQAVACWLPNILFLWCLLKGDVFHFFFDGGIWSGMKIVPEAKWLELPLLRLAGKRVIASAYGSDVRTRADNERWCSVNICQECPEPGRHCICDAGAGAVNTKYYRDWCNELLAMGDMHDFVFDSRSDFNYWPINVNNISAGTTRRHDGPVRLAHSPNHRFFKGTRFIEQAVASLKVKGFEVELDVIEKVSNEEAKRRYGEADVVVAQCLAGWMGYTEIEAMAAGKPVVGYIRSPEYLQHTPGCPLVSASPSSLEEELEKLVSQPNLRESLGRQGRKYVEKYWSYEALAPHYDELHKRVWNHNGLWSVLKRKWRDFRHGETGYRVAKTLEGSELGEWVIHSDPFLNMRRIESGCYGQPATDSAGRPRMFYDGRYVDHPGVVGLYAMNAFHCLLQEPETRLHRERFLRAASWLRDRLVIDEKGTGRWYYHFIALGRPGKMHVPWVSCFSQAVGLSMLMRAEQLSPGEGYGEAAHAAALLYRTSIEDEGILCIEDGLTFLEEYPEAPPSHVLNGFITAVMSLHEYWRVYGDPWAKQLFDDCVDTIVEILPRYEDRAGLRYDLQLPAVVNVDYYYFIVQQMRALHQMTGKRVFRMFARRWSRRLYRQKLAKFAMGRSPL